MDFLRRRDAGAPINHPEPTPMTRFHPHRPDRGDFACRGRRGAELQPGPGRRPQRTLVINGCPIWPYTRCPGADLRHASLAGRTWLVPTCGANLTRADLRGANLSAADLDAPT